MRHFFALSLSFLVLLVGGAAHAETISYQFTASIINAGGPESVTGLSIGDTVSGTFSFDTDADSTSWGVWLSQTSHQDTGDIQTDAVSIQGGTDGVLVDGTWVLDNDYVFDHLDVLDSESGTVITNLSTGTSTDASIAWEQVSIYLDEDAFDSTALPTSLELADLSKSRYVLRGFLSNGQQVYAEGMLTSLSRSGSQDPDPTEVPELSANGTVSAITVVLGGAYVMHTRRRFGAAS